ncbi:MAG: hypothetical protein AAGF04_05970 [Chlamydiota bacterium]
MITTAFMQYMNSGYAYTSARNKWGVAQIFEAVVGIARIVADLVGRALDFFAHALYLAGHCLYYCYASCASNPSQDTDETARLISIHSDFLVKSTFGLVSVETIAGIVKAAVQGVFGPIFNPKKVRVYAEDFKIYWNSNEKLLKYCSTKPANTKKSDTKGTTTV